MNPTIRSICALPNMALPLLLLALISFPVPSEEAPAGMTFLQFGEGEFRAGLVQHGMEADAGFRLLNTGFRTEPFGERWLGAPLLATAQASGRPYYIDRIMGGMPFQSLDGIEKVSAALKGDPNFIGFQAHEWANSPTHDYHRIHKLILDKGLPFDAASFATIEKRTATPYFSTGDFSIFRDLYREIATQKEVETYLADYFKTLVALTDGEIVSVTGHGQVHHTALRLGAKNVMAEIGNQVPLTALQIASVRGAARQHGKPFGAYYEPWGGQPTGCSCATKFSRWWPLEPEIKELMDGYNIGAQHGSSRSLQRRLLYYAWLSGATWWSEEWGAENYFSNWEDYPLTEYGRIVQEFQQVTKGLGRPEPDVPVALILPPDCFGIDIRYVAGAADTLWRMAPGDDFHKQLRAFAKSFLATQPTKGGQDSHNLTPSPWIGCFDVFDGDVSPALLAKYACVLSFDTQQAAGLEGALRFDTTPETAARIQAAIEDRLPYRVTGHVGATQARLEGRYLLGVFNNLGVTKTSDGEVADPEATETATVHGVTEVVIALVGGQFIQTKGPDVIELRIPAGELVVLSFPEPSS